MSIYGIDLGTTNSLIGLHDTNYLSEIVPSCVNMETGEAGARFYDDVSAMRSFKIDMSMGTEGITSRTASKFVLEELVRTAKKDTGDDVKDVCISVPAYFSDSQRVATIKAAEAAGLNVKGLVNEPTAAATYITQNHKGLYVVFDLGGGTFDCTILDSRFGTFDVQATDGLCLGGDNFDTNIMRNFIKEGSIPFHHMNKEQRAALKHFASKIKVQMQKVKAPIDVDLTPYGGGVYTFTPDTYVALMKMTFGNAINCMKRLVHEWIPSTEVYQVLLVGGSTHCPYLHDWIEDEIGVTLPSMNYDPDRVVAQGAAYYATLIENGSLGITVSDVTPALSVGLIDGTCDVIVQANSKIPLTEVKMFTNSMRASALILDLYQGNNIMASANEKIGTMTWDYGEMKEPYECHVMVKVSIDVNGVITFSANEDLKPEQSVVLNRNIKAKGN